MSPPPWLPCNPSHQSLLPYLLQKYPRCRLSLSVKMKVKAFHWSSQVFNGFPSQCVKANKTLCGLAPLTSPITSSTPALPTQFQLYLPPCCPCNMPGIFLLCLCTSYSLCLAFSCPDIHMDHSLRSLLQNHLCNEAFPAYPHENAAHIHIIYPYPPPVFSSLYLVSANMLYIFIYSLFVSSLIDTRKIRITAIINFHLFPTPLLQRPKSPVALFAEKQNATLCLSECWHC